MFPIIFMSIALLDELLFWMRCRQLRHEAREAAERLIDVLKDSQQESQSLCMNEQIRKVTQARRRKINQNRWTLDLSTIINSKSGFNKSRILTNGISTCWILEMATWNVTVRVVIWSVVDVNVVDLNTES